MSEFHIRKPELPVLQLSSQVYDSLIRDSLKRYPLEACGALFGEITPNQAVVHRYLPIDNKAQNPEHAFTLSPDQWIRCCYTPGLIGIYHSHPGSLPMPSQSDIRELQHYGSLISLYLIGGQHEEPPGTPDGFYLNAYAVIKESDNTFTLALTDYDLLRNA